MNLNLFLLFPTLCLYFLPTPWAGFPPPRVPSWVTVSNSWLLALGRACTSSQAQEDITGRNRTLFPTSYPWCFVGVGIIFFFVLLVEFLRNQRLQNHGKLFILVILIHVF